MIKNSVQLVVITLVLYGLSFTAIAAEVKNLYQAEVASGESNWQQLALEQVLIRVSGQANVASQAEIQAELKQASTYVKQYTAVRHNGENMTRVVLDSARVNLLLQKNNIPVWGELRPDTLIWLVQQQAGERKFIKDVNSDVINNLKQAFNHAALPLLLPLYDMDDLVAVSESDVWAGFWQQINQASQRYNADVIIAVTIDQTTANTNNSSADKSEQWRLTWQRQDNTRIIRDQIVAADEASMMQGFATKLAQQLASQFASVLSEQSGSTLLVDVEAVNSLTDLVTVQQLLQQLVGVSQVTISQFSQGKASYSLQAAITSNDLLKALQFNKQFKLQSSSESLPVVDSSVMPPVITFRYLRH